MKLGGISAASSHESSLRDPTQRSGRSAAPCRFSVYRVAKEVASSRRTPWHFYWLCALILSFAYERPIAYLTPYDKLNPRLFHAILVAGVVLFLYRPLRWPRPPQALETWRRLVLWFCICSIIWTAGFLPWEYGAFSLYGAAQYVLGVVCIYMATAIPLTGRQKQILVQLAVLGGVFVAAYCIPEYRAGGTVRQITEDKELLLIEGTLLGPLGSTYFHLVQYQTLAFCLACASVMSARRAAARIAWGAAAVFVSWPSFFSGSRTGPGLLAVAMAAFLVADRFVRRPVLIIGMLAGMLVLGVGPDRMWEAFRSGRTGERFLEQKGGNDEVARLLLFQDFTLTNYLWEGASVPFIGAGFNVAPRVEGGVLKYRVDYGVHNIYLFVFEQAGVVGVYLFLAFVLDALRGLRTGRGSPSGVDRSLAVSMTAFLVSVLVVGLAGQIFWRGFGTQNFNTYVVLLLVLAVQPTCVRQRSTAMMYGGRDA